MVPTRDTVPVWRYVGGRLNWSSGREEIMNLEERVIGAFSAESEEAAVVDAKRV